MKLKRMLSAFLTAAMLCTLLVSVPAGAANPAMGFADITDPATARAAETLRLLNIVSGDGGGAFYPGNPLSRAQFCKMVIMAMGKGAEADAQMNRTIFSDVLSTHWARGFVNYAASTSIGGDEKGDKLMMGKGDGAFHPDENITYAEAVIVLLRVLGYNAKELSSGANWYDGAIAAAKSTGLSDGVALNHNSVITRGQTAILFENMLYTPTFGGKDSYLVTNLGGQRVKEAVILSLDATTADGTTDAVLTTASPDPYKSNHATFDKTLEGIRAELVLDKDGKVIAIEPAKTGTAKTVSVVSTEATYVVAAGGEKLELKADTVVYKDGETLTYEKARRLIKPSTQAVFYYANTGKLEYIFLPATDVAETAAVATATGGNPFANLVGSDTGYRVVKNGLSASLSDVQQYDVGTYDKASKTLYVSDLRLTGVYENVAPSPVTPTVVTVLGAEFPVLSSAYDTLSRFEIGDTLTLLLSADGQVAGAVKPTEAKSTTVGVVNEITGFDKEKGNAEVTVAPIVELRDAKGNLITISGTANFSSQSGIDKMIGQLVTVSSSKIGRITISRLTASGATGTLDVAKRTLGDSALAENVKLYERVGNGEPKEISFAQLTRATVPAAKISYVGKDYAGRVNILVFDDVTGDSYVYGIAETSQVQAGSITVPDGVDKDGNPKYKTTYLYNGGVAITNGDSKKSEVYLTGQPIKDGIFIGIAPSLDKVSSNHKLAAWVELKTLADVPRAAFDFRDKTSDEDKSPLGTVIAGGMTLPISGDVACYNKTTRKWFATLNDAWSYSDSLTIYYDKAPQEGGKVRLVVVE